MGVLARNQMITVSILSSTNKFCFVTNCVAAVSEPTDLLLPDFTVRTGPFQNPIIFQAICRRFFQKEEQSDGISFSDEYFNPSVGIPLPLLALVLSIVSPCVPHEFGFLAHSVPD
jgi:hypothetical protein